MSMGIGSHILSHLCERCHAMLKAHVRTGKLVYFPKGRSTVDISKIKKLRNSGMTITEIALHFKLSERRIYQLLQKAG